MTSIMRHLGLDEMRSPWPREARHVALVGNPKCGKSTIAQMLEDEFGGIVCDDGLILRRALPILTGVPGDWCFTQEGKGQVVTVGNRSETVRQGLGELGNYLEARYGDDIIPLRTMQIAMAENPEASFYIYPSVRKTQGRCYRRMGGIVIQIDNPSAPPSGNAFDEWDRSCVDIVITNDPDEMGLDELREYVHALPGLLADAR